MHKRITIAALAIAIAAAARLAPAAAVYGRASAAITTNTASCTITPAVSYAGCVLKRVWVEDASVSNCTFVVYRVIERGTVRQQVASVTCAGLSGSAVPAQYAAISSGEAFLVTNTTARASATIYLDIEVQRRD